MAEFSLKDTLIGGGILFGIGVFIKKVKGKKQVEDDSQDWGGDPNGQLAKALARAREESKKPREPLKIERLGAETRKLKKDSCCCGATTKNPCECMYQGISPCSSTCPCALENKKKEQSVANEQKNGGKNSKAHD